jgi:hypothetical protein
MRRRPVLFEFWDLPSDAAVREPAPGSIPSESSENFERLLTTGLAADLAAVGEELFVNIGLDFGTSATKVIVRFPYEAGIPTIAIPAPVHCRSMRHPYLWQTVLWITARGEFKSWPEPDAHLLHALKQGVMGQHADGIVSGDVAGGMGATRAEAAAAFLAFVIRYTRGWLLHHRPQIFRRRDPVWFVNVGLPAANFDNSVLAANYRRVAAAALLLASFQTPITVETTRLFLADRHVLAAAGSPVEAEGLGIAIVPETAAEVAGFAKSTNRAPGLYLMVDVGAMTFDACTFGLRQRDRQDFYSLWAAQIRPLGVDAFHWFLGHGKTETGFVQQCDRCLHEVVWGTKTNRDPNAECWKAGNDLPVFLVGGGAQNQLHRQIVDALHPWLRHHASNEGVRLLELPIPTNIELPVPLSDFGRLAVAWGLSYPPSEIGEILPPSVISDMPPPRLIDISSRFTSKDYV